MSHFHQPLGRTRSTCCQMPSLDKFFNVRTCCSVHTRHLIQCFPEFINYRDKNNTYIIKQASEYSHSWENISLEIRIQLLQNWWKLVESSLQLRCYTCLGPEKYIASIRTVGHCCKLPTLCVTVYRAGPVPSLPKEGLWKHSKVTGLFST